MAAFECPADKAQAFLWDVETPGLAVRATSAGVKAFVFQRPFNGQSPRITIGRLDAWRISDAQSRARELQRLIDSGRDPRQVKAESLAEDAAKRSRDTVGALTVAEVWPRYMAEGKPRRKAAWKPRYVADLLKAADPGGRPKKRGKGLTKPGHLAALMPLRLAEINQDVIRDWYRSEARTAPIQAARAVAMFSGFLGWCSTKKDLRDLVDRNAARASDLGDVLPGVSRRRDALEVDQLEGWFAGTEKLRNRVAAAYLQVLVLTGARREELASLAWANVDFRWKKLTIADKVDATRVIPLTPYVAALLRRLQDQRSTDELRNPFVFASNVSDSRHIAEPRGPHAEVLADAGIPHVSIHGLRRTFSLLGEAAGAPAGAIAQVMGHKPSAVAEGYRPRSTDALRPFLLQIERFILEKAKVDVPEEDSSALALRIVAGATKSST
nr:integrase family protein [Schlegelella koreensis]